MELLVNTGIRKLCLSSLEFGARLFLHLSTLEFEAITFQLRGKCYRGAFVFQSGLKTFQAFSNICRRRILRKFLICLLTCVTGEEE